ncbi:cation-translocating P-type ATPase [Clostridium akagii]|uniref:cation-translocating P-type ATPase n=1 Tax=Clostridium akagii TaxID=91623 RepID=UPI00055EAA99|nr:HAD-IC family P-type ATPase [Clostridium akagii]
MLYSSESIISQSVYDEKLLSKRIRIPVKIVYRNGEVAQRLVKHMVMLSGVIHCKANPITGNVLVVFNEELANEKNILEHLKIFIGNSKTLTQRNVIKLNSKRNDKQAKLEINAKKIMQGRDLSESSLWHYKDYSLVATILGTDKRLGLNHHSITQRTKKFGFNVLSEKKKESIFNRFIQNIKDFSTKLLIVVSGASFLIGKIPDAIAIIGIVILQTTLSTLQQNKAENSIYSLKDMMVHKVKVIRDGYEQEINSKYIVPGDLIMLEAGEKIPADARIIECNNLKTSEASLTGESLPVSKSTEVCNKYADLGDRFNMVYMGTDILSGRGKALVVNTGMNTEIGKIATMIQNINTELTPLQKKMMNFTNNLTKICISMCFIAGIGGLVMGRTIGGILTMVISFSVGAMPESLPAIVTVAMAVSVQRMAKRKAIVRKLPSVETLGAANVICCDKTGTLTMNEMTVRKIYVDNTFYSVSGTGYDPKGEITSTESTCASKSALGELLRYGVLCNNSSLSKEKECKWVIKGDPTEGALITVAKKFGIDIKYIKETFKRLQEIPFESSRRYMTVLVETPEGKIAICKGAMSSVIKNCKTIYENGEEKLLTLTHREKLNEICTDMGKSALRVLGFSFKKIEKREEKNIENNHVFLGMVGMEDPPREDVKKSIQKCHNAGIEVVMITGDNKNTASAIGNELGILTNGMVISGFELENMSDSELDSKIGKVQVFARTSPKQKLRIVKAFKRFGCVVAMTGDGVNDAPAIKEANIGIAMGCNGSDVAKDVADITLVDDKFSTIVSAIEEGRNVSNNITKSVSYLLTGSVGEMIAIFMTTTFTRSLPLLSIQILLVNVICESILGAPLALEVPSEDIMNKPPLKKEKPIIDGELSKKVLKRGIGIGLSTFAAFEIPQLLGMGIAKARTIAFTNLVFTQIINCYYCRNNTSIRLSKYMVVAMASSVALFTGIIYVPVIRSLIGTVPLNIMDWTLVSALTIISRI